MTPAAHTCTGPTGNTVYVCSCGRVWDWMSLQVLCALSHGEGEERDEKTETGSTHT